MKRLIVVVACLVAAGGLGCGDDEDTAGSGGGGGTGGQGGSPTGRIADVLALTGDATAGAMVFSGSCGQGNCHGADGTAPTTDARDLSTHVPDATDAELIQTVIDGSVSGGAVMPPLGGQYSDQEIADVVAYLRATFN